MTRHHFDPSERSDTPARRGHTVVASLMVLAVGVLAASFCAAEATRLDARVVWVSGSRAILAWTDSLAIEAGDGLTFELRGRTLARGEVASVVERGVAIATITTGSLAGVRRLDQVRVLVSRSVPRLHTLRIGYPSHRRANPFRSGDTLGMQPPPEAGYRADVAGERALRFVRDAADADPRWPDTLSIRRFDDSADQEIALQRGEIDVAVFWPGEPSRSLREDDRRWSLAYGRRSRGAIVAMGVAHVSPEARDAIDELNRVLIGGDLERWVRPVDPHEDAMHPRGQDFARNSLPAVEVRYQVDPDWPLGRTFERFLNRSSPAISPGPSTVRLSYADLPVADLVETLDSIPVFTVRYPVVYRPELRRSLEAIGIDRLIGRAHTSNGEARR